MSKIIDALWRWTPKSIKKHLELRGIKYRRNYRNQVVVLANKYVTPFLGFMLSDFYLSNEVEEIGLNWLAPDSRHLKVKTINQVNNPKIIYCQSDQLEEFAAKFLEQISFNFILIAGKHNLPKVSTSLALEKIFSHKNVIKVFMQNSTIDHPLVEAFPYGVKLNNLIELEQVINEIKFPSFCERTQNVLIPFATVHSHLSGRPLLVRKLLKPHMMPKVNYKDYLKQLSNCRFVISPHGDRPDTYRHWESIIMGAYPIIENIGSFQKVFNSSAIFVDSLLDLSKFEQLELLEGPDRSVVLASHWRAKVYLELLEDL